MKISVRLLLFVVAALFLVAACGHSGFDRQVQRAEALMDSHPDSALSIAGALLPDSPAERARVALLLAKARYKAYVSLTDDSLISIAADYYAGRGDSLETQALFLLSETYYEIGDNPKSLVIALEAEQTLKNRESWFYAGMIHRLLAQIYACYYSYSNEYKHRLEAADDFRKASKVDFAKWEELDAAISLTAVGDHKTAHKLMDAIEFDTIGMSDSFKARFHRYQAYMQVLEHKDYYTVIDNIIKAGQLDNGLTSHDFTTLSRAYLSLGDVNEAERYLDSALLVSANPSDKGNAYLAKSEISSFKGDFETAYQYSLLYNNLVESLRDSILSSPIESIVADYYGKENKLIFENVSKSRTILLLTILILFFVAMTLFCIAYIYKRKNTQKKERIWQLAKEIEQMRNGSNNDQSDFYETLTNSLGNLQILGTKFFNIPSSSSHYQDSSIKKIIDSFSSEQMLQKLEKIIDKRHPGIVDEINTYYPKLPHKQKLLLYYSILGFSSEAICAVVSVTEMNALYALRSRLRKTLSNAQSPSYNTLMGFLSRSK